MKDVTTNRSTIWALVIIGFLALGLGALIYVLDRPASQTYFVPEGVSLYDHHASWFGLIGNYLPDFLHAFAFCLITIGVLGGGRKVAVQVCLFWLFVDGLFEIGQHDVVAKAIIPFIPNWFAYIPVLDNTESYFTAGSFDLADLLAVVLGVVTAYTFTRLRRFSGERGWRSSSSAKHTRS